jgi:hypothetical protein
VVASVASAVGLSTAKRTSVVGFPPLRGKVTMLAGESFSQTTSPPDTLTHSGLTELADPPSVTAAPPDELSSSRAFADPQ